MKKNLNIATFANNENNAYKNKMNEKKMKMQYTLQGSIFITTIVFIILLFNVLERM